MEYNISMFFPAYNEQENIPILVNKAKKVLSEVADKYEIIIIVYEGSTDNSINVVKELSKKDENIKLIIQPRDKKGVGHAIKMGFEHSQYELIFYSDSDNQFNLDEFKKFLPYVEEYDIIAGYRFNRQESFVRILTSKIYNILVSIIFGTKEKDVDCAFRLVKKKVFEKVRLICKLGLGTTEILAKARKSGYKIKQLPVHHYPRKIGKSIFFKKGTELPRLKVVTDLLKEMITLKKDLRKE